MNSFESIETDTVQLIRVTMQYHQKCIKLKSRIYILAKMYDVIPERFQSVAHVILLCISDIIHTCIACDYL